MSKHVQIQYDTNCYDSNDSQTCLNLFGFNILWFVTIHIFSQTCLNLFRINKIWILKHVRTWNQNMFKLFQIQYDTNCYNSNDSQTCLNLFCFNILWFVTIHIFSQTCLNLFRINKIWILKHVRTWNPNMMKYSKIWANGTKKV